MQPLEYVTDNGAVISLTTNMFDNVTNCYGTDNSSFLPDSNCTETVNVETLQVLYIEKFFYIALGIFGIVANLYVLIVICLYKPMRKSVANIYIANQSLIDGVAALFLVFTTAYPYNGSNDYRQDSIADKLLCGIWFTQMPQWGVLDSSTYNIVSLTFERYFAIVHPIWHAKNFSNKKLIVRLNVGFVWFIGPVYNAAYMIATSGIAEDGTCAIFSLYSSAEAKRIFGIFDFWFEFLLPIILIVSGYSMIAIFLKKRVRKLKAISLAVCAQDAGNGMQQMHDGIAAEAVVDDNDGQQRHNINVGGGIIREGKERPSMTKAMKNVLMTSALIAVFFVLSWSLNEVLVYILS